METILAIWELDYIKQFVEEYTLNEIPTETNIGLIQTMADFTKDVFRTLKMNVIDE